MSLAADDDAQCEILRRQIAYFSVTGDRAAEADRIEQLRERADRSQSRLWQARAWLAAGQYQLLISAIRRRKLRQAVDPAQQADDDAAAPRSARWRMWPCNSHFDAAQAALKLAEQLAGSQSNRSVLVTGARASGLVCEARLRCGARGATQMLEVPHAWRS
jgi:hypothetical protein